MLDEFPARIFISQWVVRVFATALLPGFAETSYRLGISARRKNEDAAEGRRGALQGAAFGLLGAFASSFACFHNEFRGDHEGREIFKSTLR
ncbi:MAG: hypothetical protein ABIT37_18870 [Luteolibacter sp.]